VRALEHHLLRHTNDETSVPMAVDAAHASLRALHDTGVAGREDLVWVHLDWTRVLPRLWLAPVGAGTVPCRPADTGLTTVDAFDATALRAAVPAPQMHDLMVPREVVVSFDPDVGSIIDLDPVGEGPSAATVALAAAGESHPVASPDQVAAAAGALLADASLTDADPIATVEDAVTAFGRLHEALGGTFRAVSVEKDRVELMVDTSPFGSAVRHLPSLSRITEALAGRLAARVHGKATVVHDESIASGDPADRLQIFFGDVEDEVCGSTYTWPPAGAHAPPALSPRLEMSVALPRQSHSVPVIRRLAAQILRAFGVAADNIHDVELAISEACANVIQHAVDSDGYEVSIELAAERCAITVHDRGDGFDAAAVRDHGDPDAESGRGLSLMRALVDNLNFVSEPKIGAVVHMVKQLDYDQHHPFRPTAPA
jgi:serine/threonine-protein kinase RsbW